MRAMAKRTKRASKTGRVRPAPGVQLGEQTARAMVLQGAARLFSELGVRAPSVEDLLAASGISRRTFYRLYDGKEAVLAALYELGTEQLVDECRLAMRQESELLRQVERCIDAHLTNARHYGRLVFVLGGEAQRQESALHARRMQVHDQIAEMLAESAASQLAGGVDRLLLCGLLLALEGVTRIVLTEGQEGRQISDAALRRARKVMLRMASAALAGRGAGVTPLPPAERRVKARRNREECAAR